MFIKNIIKKLDLDKIESLIKDGYITRDVHPSGELFIYNYSQKAMWEGYWTDETLQCRGLIADIEGNIVARPFPKFFNYEQHQGNLPDEPFEVYEKLDGSLGILYFYKDKPYIATRGSFDSEQARVANDMLNTYNKNILKKNYTYLFVIIYPKNRIVVNYKDKKELVLISTIETKTGKEIIHHEGNYFPNVKRYDEHEYIPINLLSDLERPNRQGFVIRFQSGLRIKLEPKHEIPVIGNSEKFKFRFEYEIFECQTSPCENHNPTCKISAGVIRDNPGLVIALLQKHLGIKDKDE